MCVCLLFERHISRFYHKNVFRCHNSTVTLVSERTFHQDFPLLVTFLFNIKHSVVVPLTDATVVDNILYKTSP